MDESKLTWMLGFQMIMRLLLWWLETDRGNLLYVATKLAGRRSPYLAKLKALLWAMDYAKLRLWDYMFWETDAANVFEGVQARTAPNGWASMTAIEQAREYLNDFSWHLQWVPREANSLTDAIAACTLSSLVVLLFDTSIMRVLCLLNV